MEEPLTKHIEQSIRALLDHIDEASYLLRSPANVEHLNKSMTQFRMGNVFKKYTIEE